MRRRELKIEYYLVDFCSSLLLNALLPSNADGQSFRGAEVQKSVREFSHGLDFSSLSARLCK